jgi:hypothetical protein
MDILLRAHGCAHHRARARKRTYAHTHAHWCAPGGAGVSPQGVVLPTNRIMSRKLLFTDALIINAKIERRYNKHNK